MNIAKEIETIITKNLDPVHFEIINQSHLHKGHAGDDGSGQTHFKLIVVSKSFDACSRIQKSRMVNSLLKPLMDKGLHAISLKLYTPKEYGDE